MENVKRQAWDIWNEDMEFLWKNGSKQYFQKNFPNLQAVFLKETTAVVCIDEGCAHKDYNGKGKLTVAGAGILLSAISEEERVQIVAEMFTRSGIQNITSHGGCGAVGLAYKRDFPDSNPTLQELEDYGKKWTEKVAAEMGRMGREARAEHIPAEEMERPAEFHTARAVYFDGVGGFNPNKEIGLPMGFVISRRFLPDKYAAEELKVAVNIAFGQHGFGKMFTEKSPFMVVPLAGNETDLESLKEEIKNALGSSENFSKIKIDGLVVE